MARLLGPDPSTRTIVQSRGRKTYEFSGRPATVYTDAAATVLASIAEYGGTSTPGATISGSVVRMEAGSRLPRFWFPDGYDTLYVRVVGLNEIRQITADTDARLDAGSARLGNGFVGLGDSISSVTGGAGLGNSWTIAAPMLSNQRLQYLGNAGVTGNNTTQMLARVSDVIALGPKVVTVLGGTNDLTQGVSFATWNANIQAIVAQLRAAGIMPVLCTIPPRGNTTYLANNIKWNNWLRNYARVNGLPLLDFFAALVDPATGTFASGFDSGDALHPSPAGHMAMAGVANTQLAPMLPPYSPPRPLVNTGDADNLVANPLLLNGAGPPTGFTASGTGGLTGYTESLVTDSDFLGKAWDIDFATPSAVGFRQLTYTLAGGSWTAGDTLLFVARMKVVSQSSLGITSVSTNIGARLSASFFSASTPTVNFVPGDNVVHAGGLCAFRQVVPASTTSVAINVNVNGVPTTGALKARFGEIGVFNLTALGLV